MGDYRNNLGRWLGATMLADFSIGIFSNFKLQSDLFAGEGLLVNAAAYPTRIGLIIVLGILTSLLSVWLAVALTQAYGRERPVLASLYLSVVVACMAIAAVEYSTLYAFRTLSEHYQAAGPDPASVYQALKKTLGGLRNGVHMLHMSLGGLTVLLLFTLLYQLRLLPRLLALVGAIAAATQMIAISPTLFGGDVIYPMLAPLALFFLGTAIWLTWKGFPAPDASRSAPGMAAAQV